MVQGADGRRRRRRRASPSPSPPPAARCGPRSSSDVVSPGRGPPRRHRRSTVDWTEMTAEQKATAMARARWNAQGAAGPNAGARRRPGARRRLRQGRRRQVVGHRQPRRRAGRSGASPSACSTPTSGASRSPACSASRVASPPRPPTTADAASSPTRVPVGAGRLEVVSMGFLVDDEDRRPHVAGPHPQPGRPALPRGRRAGATTSTTCSSTCRPGTGDVQMGLARMLPRRPRCSWSPRRRCAAQKVAVRAVDMARKSYLRVARRDREHERLPLRARRPCTPVRRGRRRRAGRRGRRAAPRHGPARARRVRRRRRRRARRRSATGDAADAFRAIADRLVDEAVPPVAMAGCSARMLEAAIAALDAASA